jgi:hypothetical protein
MNFIFGCDLEETRYRPFPSLLITSNSHSPDPQREYKSKFLITHYYPTGGNPSLIGKNTEWFLKGIE